MKKMIFGTLVAGCLFASCDSAIDGQSPCLNDVIQWGEITFSLAEDPFVTKSTSAAAETSITTLQILVYNSSGNLVSYAKSNTRNLTASVPLGVAGHTVYAVANVADELSGCSTTASLISKVSYLKDNSMSSLHMIGKAENKTFTSGNPVSVNVKRFASKVQIDVITTDFKIAAYRAQDFKLRGIFLINVNGSCPFSQIAAPGIWYNQMRYVSGDCDSFISDRLATPVTIQQANGDVSDYTTRHIFYCYANPTTSDTHGGSSFTPRRTRLVVEASLGSSTYYYPIDIVSGTENTLKGNTTYTVSKLTVTGPGVDNPDDELSNGNISFEVTVDDWETGFSKTITY